MLPLALLAFGWSDHPGQRLEESMDRVSPQTRMQVAEIKDKLEESGPLPDWVFHLLPAAFYDALPDSRIEGALLARGSYAHWAIALPAAAAYLALIVVLFPRGGTRPMRLLLVGLFTSTVGILILVCLQLLAEATRGVVIVVRRCTSCVSSRVWHCTPCGPDRPGYSPINSAKRSAKPGMALGS
jgi:hypothetical protein